MRYKALLNLLRQFEAKWTHPTNAPPAWVRPATVKGGNVQYVAMRQRDDADQDPDLPVVVDVGINYTQGNESIPGLEILDDVDNEKEKKCIEHCHDLKNRPAWLKSALVGPSATLAGLFNSSGTIRDFHLVMTNLSPWITTKSWESSLCDHSSGIGAELLVNPPYPLKGYATPFPHLDDLFDCLESECSPLWIGHGRVTVPSHFRMVVQRHRITEWMLVGNLSAAMSLRVDRNGFVKFN